jgi:hypothetical protein
MATRRIEGAVVDPQGKPLADVPVYLAIENSTMAGSRALDDEMQPWASLFKPASPYGLAGTKTDRQGRFVFNGISGGLEG